MRPMAFVAFAGTLCAVAAAQTPINPLRPGSTAAALRLVPTGENRAAMLAGDPAADEPVTFPGGAIQPELLPPPSPPADSQTKLDYFQPQLADDAALDHLVHPLFEEPWFAHSDPNDPRRHIGIGQPLIGTSWRNRPWFFGAFVGGIMMNDLLPGEIYQNDTTFVGARLGFDFDHYWGLEGRWAFARPDLEDSVGRPLFPASRDNFGDVSLAWYPFGDARWRPYLSGGLGFATFRLNNELGERLSEAAVTVPLGFGVKYYYGPWFTLRFDFTDNIGLGNARVSGMHNVSLMVGAEYRFGGRRPSYFPWHNNTAYW
jgi:hypothetical protein